MLDQSFSAHNFETIYSLESRKGNIDVNTMPEEYRMVIARAEDIKKEIYSLRVKKDRSPKESELLEERKSDICSHPQLCRNHRRIRLFCLYESTISYFRKGHQEN